jgi:hypothetical protein
MFLLISIILIIIALFAALWPSDVGNEQIRELKLKFKKYSGVNPELYMSYINNLELMSQNLNDSDMASLYLYNAMDSIENLALYIPAYDLTDDIMSVVTRGEQMILDSDRTFRPKYLNNIITE